MEFRLNPAYCLYNGAAVLEQNENHISFLIEDYDNESLKASLRKAFSNYVMSNPKDFRGIPEITFVKGNRNQLRKCVSALYEVGEKNHSENRTKEAFIEKENEAAAVLLLENILSEAKAENATDIHIEGTRIRFRIRGQLTNEKIIDIEKSRELVQRIKLLSGMNVIDSRNCQDGHFCYGENNSLFVRTSSIPVIGNGFNSTDESVVLRLLDVSRVLLKLPVLGFNLLQQSKIEELCELENGLVIICGPTGSGKSTTAAALLSRLVEEKKNSLKIVSLEDPPEYYLPGVTQIKIDEKRHNGFNEALNHIFRQDPDVLMIGEIRDEKSCSAAVRASMTGHLVFATLHTDSPQNAFFRLRDLGADVNVLASVLKGVIVQQMNYFQDQVNLLAEVCIPKMELQLKVGKNLLELDDCFSYFTNAMEVLGKTIGQLGKIEKAEPAAEKKSKNRVAASGKTKTTSRRKVYPSISKTRKSEEEIG